jgi:hypothetical protein
VLGSASPPHEARIGLDARIHTLQRVLIKVTSHKARSTLVHLGFSAQSEQSSATYRMLRFLVRTCLRTRVRPAGHRKVSV